MRECIDNGDLNEGDAVETSLAVWTHTHGFCALYLMGRFGKQRVRVRTQYDATMRKLFAGLDA